ncbi:hypothetical protein D3C75_529530 [compost metagenome]
MNTLNCTPETPIVDLNTEQRRTLIDLISIERSRASRWWTMLNEMRHRGELPYWVKAQEVGSTPDHDRWLTDCYSTNKALFGHACVRGEASQQMFRCLPELRG